MLKIISLLKDESAVTAIEWSLLAALLATGAIAAITASGGTVLSQPFGEWVSRF